MNINDYTYHLCDRFVLLSVAFLGLLGTSYILINGTMATSSSNLEQIGISIQQSFSNDEVDSYLYFIKDPKPVYDNITNANTSEIIITPPISDTYNATIPEANIDSE